jgi:4-hydroxyphenylpyruvate dioxygenase
MSEYPNTSLGQDLNDSLFDGFAYIELYVGNVHQAVHYYRTAYGFKPIGFMGMETGIRDRTSYILSQNNIKLVITSPISKDSAIARHLHQHADSVKDIALKVKNCEETYHHLLKKGAEAVSPPKRHSFEKGELILATVKTFGENVHTLVEEAGHFFELLPNYERVNYPQLINPELFEIDHLAICLEEKTLNQWVDFYKKVFGFCQSHQEDVSTEYSAMNSKVVQDGSEKIKFALIEPANGKRKSQIDEFLNYYGGAGVQHIAFSSANIINSIHILRKSGIDFLVPPITYYDRLTERVGTVNIPVSELRKHNVLVDRDKWGYLMQTFTKPAQTIPTMFYEIIQRRNAKGFGAGNIKALFEAVEFEQQRRGNL